jgi:phosphoglycolate phosphatase
MRALSTEDAIFIGDNENDAAAARAAGLPLVLMRYGYARRPVETLGATVLLDRFDQLPAVLPDLAGRAPYPIGQDP